ncbi:hypothetical protein BH10PLA2_BH10PLA2_34420 [soil metagenome]
MAGTKHDCACSGGTLIIEKLYPYLSKRSRESATSIRQLFDMLYQAINGSLDAYLLTEQRERATLDHCMSAKSTKTPGGQASRHYLHQKFARSGAVCLVAIIEPLLREEEKLIARDEFCDVLTKLLVSYDSALPSQTPGPLPSLN